MSIEQIVPWGFALAFMVMAIISNCLAMWAIRLSRKILREWRESIDTWKEINGRLLEEIERNGK